MDKHVNSISLTGTIAEMPSFSHEVKGVLFYVMMLDVPRRSGSHDLLPVMASEQMLDSVSPEPGMALRVEGQLRSHNKAYDGKGRLVVTAFAQRLSVAVECEKPNTVTLIGDLCKHPIYRTTPLGREITDMMIAINRPSRKSDYIPCIAWRHIAKFASTLAIGSRMSLEGRFQSRPYQKTLPDGTSIVRVAYEVSINSLHAEQNSNRRAIQ